MKETGERQENILEVRDLQLAFLGVNGRVEALRGVNLAVTAGEIVALVGESGSGKTALCRAALGLHANHAVIEHGGIWLAGQDTSTLTEKDWCALRGRVASMVFQDPMSAFDPVYPIGQQIAEVLLLHPACFAGSGIEKRTAAAAPRLLHSASFTDRESTREAKRVPQDETREAKRVPRDELRTNLCQETNCPLIKNDSSSGEKIALLPRIRQIAQTEMMRLCRKKQQELRRSAEAEMVALLAKLGFDEPARRARQYPHEVSGGMLQRAAIALAMIAKPRLLIADEPTTALDIETQQEIMALLRENCARQDCSMLFVTHDLGLAEQIADRIVVMKDGRIVEEGQSKQIFRDPQHAYTKKLLGYATYGKGGSHYHGRIRAAQQEEIIQKEAKQIAKEVKEATEASPRISVQAPDQNQDAGNDTPQMDAHRHLQSDIYGTPKTARMTSRDFDADRFLQDTEADDVLLSIRGLSKSFPVDKHTRKQVLHDVSLAIHRGEIVGLIGPSGVGKSTLARCIMGICAPDSGEVIVREGARIQMIFQDSAAAFNPHMTIAEIIAEPLVLQARRQRRVDWKRRFAKAVRWWDAAEKPVGGASHADGATIQTRAEVERKLSRNVQSGCVRYAGVALSEEDVASEKAMHITRSPFTEAANRSMEANRLAVDTERQVCSPTGTERTNAALRERVLAAMRQVELEPELADRYPYDVSGGQRQRAAIARALITAPDLIICDEPISSLDVSLQADIIHLLKKLQEERGLSLLLISHDLPMVEHISDRIVKL